MTVAPFPFPDALDLRALSAVELDSLDCRRQLYRVLSPFRYASTGFGEIVVPEGFTTDFASVPRPVWSYISPEDPVILFPSVVHDHLYTVRGALPNLPQALSRLACDNILREAMLACGARPTQAWVVYQAVRLGGGGHWK